MRIGLVFILIVLCKFSFASGWIQKANFDGIARHRTVGIAIENKAYIGLGHYNGGGLNVLFNDWWEYDPSTNAWTQKSDYLGGYCYDATGFTINNLGYVGTGRTSVNGSVLVQDFFKYNPITNLWTPIAPFTGTGRRGALSFVINDNAFVGTGETNFGRTSSFYKYDPTIDTWSQISDLAGASRTSSVGFSIGEFGYVGTGDLTSGPSNDFWQYDPSLDVWTEKTNVGPSIRQEASGFELDGKGYILTGINTFTDENFQDMWEYDPIIDAWIQVSDFQGTSRRYLTSIVLNGYVYGGLGTNGVNFSDWWVYDKYLSILEQQLDKTSIIAYPNPTTNLVVFDINLEDGIEYKNLTLELINSNGTIVRSVAIKKEKSTISISELPSGTYHYLLNYKEFNLKTEKLIVIK